MQASKQLVRVFDKLGVAQGNLAMIFFSENQNDLPNEQSVVSADIQKQKNIATTCFIFCVAKGHYNVRCYNANILIQCCGHGLIAAAKTVFSASDLSSIIINENITVTKIIDDVGRDEMVLHLPRLFAQMQPVPVWVNDLLTLADKKLLPDKAAVSREIEGYLLLEFKPALSLDVFRSMQVDLNLLSKKTKRALVVVQLDYDSNYLYTRYFAPQYGVAEDIATGSVMRFVGDYVEQNYQLSHFEVSQCSLPGGYMKIDCKAESIIITANASLEFAV